VSIDGADSIVGRYARTVDPARLDPSAVGFYAMLDSVRAVHPRIAAATVQELLDQRSHLKLIASENFSSLAVQAAQGSLLTDKYAEGYPGHHFYAGCDNVDTIEATAAGLARDLFGAEHAYVQPHSGADANLVAFLAILATRVESTVLARFGGPDGPAKLGALDAGQFAQLRDELHNQRLLAMDYYSGGHLTHGYRFNISSRLFDAHSYSVDSQTKLLDLAAVRKQARTLRPLVLLAGYSAYSRRINFAELRSIADEVGATLMVDMAHFAGLVAGRVFTGDHDPVAHAHVVTTTTHKTLRGPRGGMVLSRGEYAEAVDKGCPAILGGPLSHVMAAKAVALREASRPEFGDYAQRIVTNARALADGLLRRGAPVLTGGTDNHLLLVDVADGFGLTGRQAEQALRECGMTLNRNSLPGDVNGPWYTSGLRLGTPALTTLGMGPDEMDEIADIAARVLAATTPRPGEDGKPASKAKFATEPGVVDEAGKRVHALLTQYPLYPQIDLAHVRPEDVGLNAFESR
jgi:glycine hydroxymethyltransferase